MDDGKTFWVIERYINNELFYWSSGARGKCSRDDWNPSIADATKFFDGDSAVRVLIYACQGNGRSAAHRFASLPNGERDGAV